MSGPSTLLPFQLREWFAWREQRARRPGRDPARPCRALHPTALGDRGLMDSSVNTMMHAVRGYFRFAHIDGLIAADPAVYARLPKVHRDESRTQGLDRLELIRFLQVAQTLTVHHGALAHLLGINALRASEAGAVRIEDHADTLRGPPRPAPGRQGQQARQHAATVPVLRALEACHGQRTSGHLCCEPRPGQPRPTRRPLPHRLRRRRLNGRAEASVNKPGRRHPPGHAGTRTAPDLVPAATPCLPSSCRAFVQLRYLRGILGP